MRTARVRPTMETGLIEGANMSDRRISGTQQVVSDALIEAAVDGRADAWEALVENLAGRVWAAAAGWLRRTEDISQVSQLVWLRLADHLAEIEPADVADWVVSTTERESIRMVRLGFEGLGSLAG